MLQQIRQSFRKSVQIFFVEIILGHSTVVFESPDRSHYDHSVRFKTCYPALYIEKFLSPKIGGKTGFGHRVISQFHGHFSRCDGIATVSYIGERPSVYKCRSSFYSLHQIRLKRIFE